MLLSFHNLLLVVFVKQIRINTERVQYFNQEQVLKGHIMFIDNSLFINAPASVMYTSKSLFFVV
jgi:hypothetical protein